MKTNYALKLFIALLIVCGMQTKTKAQSFTEGFENLAALTDWYVTNNSDNHGAISWFKGVVADFPAQAGTDSSYIACNYQSDSSTTVAGTLSDWLFTPNRIFNNGDVISFYTRTTLNPATYPDNLEVRLSTNGTSLNVGTTSASVGDYTTLLLAINPTLSTTVYPGAWQQYTITISGLVGPTSGRVAFRYYVTSGGPAGANSIYIGIDTYSFTSNTSSSDATVSNVYTLGTIAKPFINPHVVTANITNTGNVAFTNKVVTLNVTGANTFTNTQTIASLAAGASTIVTFAGYTSNNAGTNTVTVSVPADAILTGNSLSVTQTVNTSSYNYAYGTTVTGGVGFNGAMGYVAAKFNTSSATTISSVNVNLNSTGRPYTLNIWDATGVGGTPGTLLYTSAAQTSAVGVLPITVSPAVPVNGGFFVGLSQNDTTNLGLSYQTETPVRAGSFYYNISTVGTWTDLSTGGIPFRLMIEPVFASCAVPTQPGTISGTATVCQGITNTYSIAAVAGATSYTWTLPSGWSGTSTTTSINAVPGATGGQITVTATNSCGTSTAQTFSVAVTSTPATPGTISGNTTVCPTTSNTYTIAAVAGATSYNWTLPSGWSGTSTTTSITAVAGATGGPITVSATNSCGTSSPVTLAVVIGTAPAQPGAITGNVTVCQNTSQTYSITAVAGATSYTWTLPGGWTGTSTTNTITTTAGASNGNIMVTATNACGTSTAQSLAVTVNPVPATPGAIAGNANVCTGVAQTYSVSPVAGATSYTWTLPAGWVGTSTTTSISPSTIGANGQVTVTANNACGSSTASVLNVTVIPVATMPGAITGATTICPNQTQVYSVSPVAGATSYIWTLPSGWPGTSTINSISATTSANGGTVSVAASNSCGTSTAQTLTVSLGTAPSQPGAITGNATICSGSTQTYSISPVAGATSYNWTLPSGWSGASTSTSVTALSGTSGSVTVVAINDCGTSVAQTLTVTVNATPTQPTAISGNASVCQGISNVYTVTPVAGATSYTWTLPGGWSGSSTTNSITATPAGASGTILVSASNSCGTSPTQSLNVTVNSAAPVQPGSISGNATVCSSSTTTYTVPVVANATSYNWTLPGGWSGTSTTNSIIVTVGTTGGTISVTASNGCGTSAASSTNVTVNTSPAMPGVISGNAAVCAGTSQTYSIVAVTGATNYTWTLPAGWVGSSITTSITSSSAGSSGNILVTANNAQCSSPAQTLAVVVNTPPATPVVINGNATVCSSANETYTVAAVTGATSYNWTLPSGWSGTSTTNSISATVGTTGGLISVSATNSCGTSATQTFAVTVNVVPVQPGTITGSVTVCSSSTQTYSIGSVAGATSYTWTLPVGWSITSGTGTNTIICTAGVAGGTISVTANNGTCASTAQTLAVAINSAPNTPGTISGPSPICANSMNTYYIAAVAGATGYVWTTPSGWTGTSTTDSIMTTANATSGNITVAASNVCGTSSASSLAITVNPLPAMPTITQNGNVLQSSVGTTYQWYLNGNVITGATTQFYTMTGNGFYAVTITDANGCARQSAAFNNNGINELSIDDVFTVYPNPASDVITINLITSMEIQTACLTNILGKTVRSINTKSLKSNSTYEVDIKDLSKGIYFLSMQVDGRLMTRKVVVQ